MKKKSSNSDKSSNVQVERLSDSPSFTDSWTEFLFPESEPLTDQYPQENPSCTDLAKILLQEPLDDRERKLSSHKLDKIIVKCCTLRKLHLPGCSAVTDKFFQQLCPRKSIQDSLLSMNIYGTSVTPAMAVAVFWSMPHLECFVYHDVSGFLQFANIDMENIDCDFLAKRNCKLQLGRVHETGIHLTFSNNGDYETKTLKTLELFLPAAYSEDNPNDVFHFTKDESGFYNFIDIYNVIMAVQPHKIFGGKLKNFYLSELSCHSVRDIDLDLLSSGSADIKEILLYSCFTKMNYYADVSPHLVKPEESPFHLSMSVRRLNLCNMLAEDVIRVLRHCPNLEELNLYEVELTSGLFEVVKKNAKITMQNCYGCPIMQFLYKFQIPRYFYCLKQRITFQEKTSLGEFFVCLLLILPIFMCIIVLNNYG